MAAPSTVTKAAPQWVRPADACTLLGCKRAFLFKLVHRGKLHPSRPSARLTLYSVSEIDALIRAAQGGAA